VGDLRARRELSGDAGGVSDASIDACGVIAEGDGEGEARRRATGDVRELPRPPDLPGTVAG
jgi:hypothetical protein